MPRISIGRLETADRATWEQLFAGYHAFYGRPNLPQEKYDEAWRRFELDREPGQVRAPHPRTWPRLRPPP
jgi:hypothetical protein